MTAPDQADTLNNPTPSPSSDAAPDAKAATAQQAESLAAALEVQVTSAKKEAAENYDRYIRAVADLENFRRRSVREKDELRQYAAGRVLEDLLPVLDNLALGLTAAKATNADLKTLVGGISMVQEQLKSSLSNHGLKEINPMGAPFDPNLHESIASQPSADIAEGNVLQVVRVGYTLNSRLLRPASVIVSSGRAPESKATS